MTAFYTIGTKALRKEIEEYTRRLSGYYLNDYNSLCLRVLAAKNFLIFLLHYFF